jgi:hypothetical protein
MVAVAVVVAVGATVGTGVATAVGVEVRVLVAVGLLVGDGLGFLPVLWTLSASLCPPRNFPLGENALAAITWVPSETPDEFQDKVLGGAEATHDPST